MSNRTVHFSRLLDIISGSAMAGVSTKVQRSALYKDFDLAKLEGKKLRELIDSNLPTFYVVDCNLIANETIEALSNNIDQYFKENKEYVQTILPKLQKSKPDLLKKLLNSLGTSQGIPAKQFLPIFSSLDKAYQDMLDTMSKRTSYIGYRNAATLFGSKLRSILKANSVFVADDGDKIVVGLPSTSRVVIGPTFESAKRRVNEVLGAVITEYVKSFDLTLRDYNKGSGFSVGNLVNAGHTSATTDTGSLIGINMPMAQEKQFLLSGTGKEAGVEDAIADLYLNAGYSIKFNQNFVKNATSLLNMQFSFVVSMPREFNTNELRVGEVKNINSYISGTVLPTIQEQITSKFKGGLLQDIVPVVSASPNVSEYIQSTVGSALVGDKPLINFIKSSIASSNSKIPIKAIKKSAVSNKIKTSASILNIKIPTIGSIKGSISYSIASLQTLINDLLPRQIKANMGDGSSNTILNLRSGRFAESAKVERMSVSREGMISAFYTYMKNPYATFSVGGAQSMPPSRDPKLLISKSIREIAASRVANRMRAIVV